LRIASAIKRVRFIKGFLFFPRQRLPAPVLMRLMRHENIQTTMAYYVDLDATELAEDLYKAHGDPSQRDGRSLD
jgi:hypothetical protein